MSRKIWYLALLFCLVILCSGFIANFAVGAKGGIEKCQAGNETQFDLCVNKLAEEKGPVVCKYLSDDLHNDCYLHAATGRNHPRTCKKISNPVDINDCYGKVSIYNQNHDALKYIKDQKKRDEWSRKLAVRFNNTDYCRLIQSVQTHGQCQYEIAVALEKGLYCYSIDYVSTYRDDCFYEIALKTGNLSLCEPMQTIRKKKCLIDVK